MKFKIGDKVRFIGDPTQHSIDGEDLREDCKKYNNIFTIGYVSNNFYEFMENRKWCIDEKEIELVDYIITYDSKNEPREMTLKEICDALGYDVKIVKEDK